ncbi:hypothetical protein [Hyphomonas pacifica]|uniref:Lipoprotein n=1 Tax=Hyphomonas pacifica TaxID=1280941 RepID=A0A8B2PFL0_9PROT|nr:hypothetical protein [Hyphomonas pacifica]RAN30615.1 hypothetical protein HY3_05555 [Hyphomonas pacifica]
MKISKLLIVTLACGLSLTACAIPRALTSVQARDATPREAALLINKEIRPAVNELADACEAGLIDDRTLEVVDRYAGPIRSAIGAYAASARPCLVVDGKLLTDPAVTGVCYRGSVSKASGAVPELLKEVGLAVGGELGNRAFWAGVAAAAFVSRDDTTADGFNRETTDYSVAVYDDAWAPVRLDADRLQACASAR